MLRWLQLAVWCCAMYAPTAAVPNTTVHAAVVLPADSSFVASAQRVKIVLDMALEKIKLSLPWLEVLPRFYDDGCKGEKGLKAAFEVFDPKHRLQCDVLFGPTCEYSAASIGRLIRYFDVPLLTTGALTWDFKANKTRRDDEFHGVVRVGPLDFQTLAKFINDINAKFNWTRFMLLYERNGQEAVSGEATCKLMMETLVQSYGNLSVKIEFRATPLDRMNNTEKVLLEEVGVDYSGYSRERTCFSTYFIPVNNYVVSSSYRTGCHVEGELKMDRLIQ